MMRRNGIWIDGNNFMEFSDGAAKTLRGELATRNGAVDFYGLGMTLPNPDPVLRKQGKDVTVYQDLLADAHLGGCVKSRKSGVRSLEWAIDRGRARSSQARLIEDVFNSLDLERIINEILDAPLFGYSVLEVMWDKLGSNVLPVDVVGKPRQWFVFDDQNALRLLRKGNPNGIELPERKFLIAVNEAAYDNPYGVAELSRCFWPITFKKGGLKFWVGFTEKYGMPYLWGKHPRGADPKETEALADMLNAMVTDAIIVTPDDESIQIVESSGKAGSAAIYRELLEFCKTEVAIAILGQNLTTEVKGGSFAAAQSHMSVRADIIETDRRLVESVMNELISWTYEINFQGSGEMPVFTMWQEEDVDKTLAERDKLLADTGQIKFTKEYFVRAYGLNEEDFDIVLNAPLPTALPNSLPANAGGIPPKTQFAEAVINNPAEAAMRAEQAAVDAAANSLPADELQKQMDGVLKPVIDLVKSGQDFNAILNTLAETYPKMDTSATEEMLSRAIFVSEMWGRLNAGNG
jgi:phage gp29-like protein